MYKLKQFFDIIHDLRQEKAVANHDLALPTKILT